MADEQIVDSAVDTGTPTNDGKQPGSNDPQNQPTGTSNTQVTAPDRKAEDDRQRGILADLQKERKARQALETQARDWQTKYETEQRRVQALAGVNPKSAEDAEIEAVRQRFGQVFPGLAKLSDQQIEKLLSVADRADNLEQATAAQWDRHGRQMLGSVVDAMKKQLGGELTERQTKQIKRAYVAEAEENPEFLARHEQGDATLVAEFVKNFSDDFLEPARRKALASAVDGQRRVPSGRDRSIVGAGDKKIDVNDPKAVEDLLVQGFRERGGSFGR